MMKRTFNLMQMWAETEKFDSDFFIKKKIYSRVVWLSSCRNPDEIFSDLIKMSSVTFKLYISEFWVEIIKKIWYANRLVMINALFKHNIFLIN